MNLDIKSQDNATHNALQNSAALNKAKLAQQSSSTNIDLDQLIEQQGGLTDTLLGCLLLACRAHGIARSLSL